MTNYNAIDIETGEIIHTFEGFDYRWYDDGKRRAKKWLKEHGYEFVKAQYTMKSCFIWVKEIEGGR